MKMNLEQAIELAEYSSFIIFETDHGKFVYSNGEEIMWNLEEELIVEGLKYFVGDLPKNANVLKILSTEEFEKLGDDLRADFSRSVYNKLKSV